MSNPRERESRRLWRLAALSLVVLALLAVMSLNYERTWWPYMLSSYLIAAMVFAFQSRRDQALRRAGVWRYLFPPEIWLHPSTRNDCILTLFSYALARIPVLSLALFNPYVLEHLLEKIRSGLAAGRPAEATATPDLAAYALYSLLVFILADVAFYVCHRLLHQVPALWELHKVHHSAKVLTPITLYREHPIEHWMFSIAHNLALFIATAALLCLYPGVSPKTVADINLGFVLLNILGQNLRHSHVWWSFGPVLEHVIQSPAQHQIHHSENPLHMNRNYASYLAVLDWLFGTLYVPKGREAVTFGLGDPREEAHYQNVWGMYVHPLKKIFSDS